MFTNLCPKCKSTSIFNFFTMNKQCSSCGNKYEKEEGYFIGAMIAGYFFNTIMAVPTFVYCVFKLELPFVPVIGIAILQLLVLQPFIFRYSRIFWINLEHKLSAHA